MGKEKKLFNPGANWEFRAIGIFLWIAQFLCAQHKESSRRPQHICHKAIFHSKAKSKNEHFFYHFLATISIQIHPDTAKMCFTKLKWIFVPHLIKLIRLERRGKGKKTKKRTIKMFKAF